ncbi:DUF1287 domain-containing protein [Mollicutes bacterium LVI A0039]|nr:DUF1287 domain-containing protein [Mollicutes bacterium LVI A0039]
MKKVIFILLIIFVMGVYVLYVLNYIKHKSYTNEYFGIEVVESTIDYDHDGIGDYQDILDGAKQTVINRVEYKSAYYEGGYPPEDEGVCTDVIWRSLNNAGYDLKALVDADIAANIEAYPRIDGKPDPNIDFRRVPNLHVFLERNTVSLTTDIRQTEEWMPGDIVIFSDNHIAIVSDVRNSKGIPFIIHNGNQYRREDDTLEVLDLIKGVTGHYRFELKTNL